MVPRQSCQMAEPSWLEVCSCTCYQSHLLFAVSPFECTFWIRQSQAPSLYCASSLKSSTTLCLNAPVHKCYPYINAMLCSGTRKSADNNKSLCLSQEPEGCALQASMSICGTLICSMVGWLSESTTPLHTQSRRSTILIEVAGMILHQRWSQGWCVQIPTVG